MMASSTGILHACPKTGVHESTGRWIRLICLAAIPVLLFFALETSPVYASAGLNMEILTETEIESIPRQVITVSARLINETDVYHECRVYGEAQVGWEVIATPEVSGIEPGGSEVIFLTITPPAHVYAGSYPINIVAYFDDDPSVSTQAEITVIVQPVLTLEVITTRLGQTIASNGDVIENSITVINHGNMETRVRMEFETRPNWEISTADELEFTLAPGLSERLVVTTHVPVSIDRSYTYRMTAIARTLEPYEGVEARSTSTTNTIPTVVSSGTIYASLEGTVEAQVSFDDDGNEAATISFENLHGDLGDGRSLTVNARNLLVVGDSSGTLIQNEDINVEYHDNTGVHVRAGDFPVDLEAPLVDRHLRGRGGEIIVSSGQTTCRLFHTRERTSTPADNTGAQIIFRPNAETEFRLTGMNVDDVSYEDGDSGRVDLLKRVGISATYTPSMGMEFTGELAHSSSIGYGSQDAWRLYGRYSNNNFAASCEWLRAGSGYVGGWHDTELRRVNVSWRPVDDFRVWSNYSSSRNNLDEIPSMQGNLYRNLSGGFSWNLGDLGRIRVSHRTNRIYDTILDHSESLSRVIVASLSHDWGDLSATASYQHQVNEGLTLEDRAVDRTLRFDVYSRLGRGSSVRLGYATGTESSQNGLISNNIAEYSIGSYFSITQDLNFSFDLQRNTGSPLGNRTYLYSTLHWDLARERDLYFRFRQYRTIGDNETEILVEYSMPISVPLSMFPLNGGLEGRVFLLDDSDTGIADVLVNLGNFEAMTDDGGYFAFPSIEAGDVLVSIDEGTLPVGLKPQIDLPVMVSIRAGSTSNVEIPVQETASVSGKVVLLSDNLIGGEETTPLADYIIELLGESGSQYRYTDSHGRYSFTDLEPGLYKAIIRTDNLQEYQEVLGLIEYEVELVPGDNYTELDFTIGLVEREIRIVISATEEVE